MELLVPNVRWSSHWNSGSDDRRQINVSAHHITSTGGQTTKIVALTIANRSMSLTIVPPSSMPESSKQWLQLLSSDQCLQPLYHLDWKFRKLNMILSYCFSLFTFYFAHILFFFFFQKLVHQQNNSVSFTISMVNNIKFQFLKKKY